MVLVVLWVTLLVGSRHRRRCFRWVVGPNGHLRALSERVFAAVVVLLVLVDRLRRRHSVGLGKMGIRRERVLESAIALNPALLAFVVFAACRRCAACVGRSCEGWELVHLAFRLLHYLRACSGEL